jgi:hypothetical protein
MKNDKLARLSAPPVISDDHVKPDLFIGACGRAGVLCTYSSRQALPLLTH